MEKSKKTLWVEFIYLGLIVSLSFHYLIWSGSWLNFSDCPYRLRWGWGIVSPILFAIILVAICRLSWWVTCCLRYLPLFPFLKVPIIFCLKVATVLLILITPVLVFLQFSLINSTKLIPEFASPSKTYSIEAQKGSDTCFYRVYRNQFIFQRYMSVFDAPPWDCYSATIRWSQNEQEITWTGANTDTKMIFRLPKESSSCSRYPMF